MKHRASNPAHCVPASPIRRRLLSSAVAGIGTLALPRLARAQSVKVRVGYWPIAAGLPFYAAIEKGYFKEAGLDVEPIKFAGAQQVMEAMLSGRADGSANGTGSANLAIGEIASPGLLKIICSNPSNVKNVLDEFLVAKDAPYKAISELKGKRVGSGPGIQNVTLCKTVLERSGVTDATVIELRCTRSSLLAPWGGSTASRAFSRPASSRATSWAIRRRWPHGSVAPPR
jgi:NitT/TauT family transport system substrate-binding protein